MKSQTYFVLSSLLCLFFILGCSAESDNDRGKSNAVLGKYEFADGWARPGAEGDNSSVYMLITNGTATDDTLLSVSSEAADKAELHESYDAGNETTSMRPAGEQPIGSGSKLRLEPGGLHIMLMDIQRDLTVGDSVSVDLEFSHVGKKNIIVPVQIEN